MNTQEILEDNEINKIINMTDEEILESMTEQDHKDVARMQKNIKKLLDEHRCNKEIK